jgi:hypothetical protein
MGCILLVLAVLLPRVALVVIFLLTNWFSQVFHTIIWPLLGFIFMPYTTLAYMGGLLSGGVQGIWALVLLIAVVVDLAHLFGGGRHYHVRHRGHIHHIEA